jgi:hypothetical protein
VRLFLAPGAERRRLALLCCILAAVVAVAPIVRAKGGDEGHVFRGKTEQGHHIELFVDDDGRLRGVETRIDSLCRGGYGWSVDWSPREAWARFSRRGSRVAVRELTSPDGRGRSRRVLVRLVGRVDGDRARGTVLVNARFYRNGREVQACESGPRRWTAGAGR